MTDRLTAMRRLARVQTQVKRLAEADLHAAERRRAETEAAANEIDAFIRDPDISSRMISLAMAQRRKVAARHADATEALGRQAEATREARRRMRLAERMVETLGEEEARALERRDLERLIEAMAGRDPETGAF